MLSLGVHALRTLCVQSVRWKGKLLNTFSSFVHGQSFAGLEVVWASTLANGRSGGVMNGCMRCYKAME